MWNLSFCYYEKNDVNIVYLESVSLILASKNLLTESEWF
jgi:hypothetical protein